MAKKKAAKRDRKPKYTNKYIDILPAPDAQHESCIERTRYYYHGGFSSCKTRSRFVKSRLTLAIEQAKSEGRASIIVWKKVRDDNCSTTTTYLVKMRVPIKAQMRCPRNKKCRASYAKVLSLHEIDYQKRGAGKEIAVVGRPFNISFLRTNLRYVKGKWVSPEGGKFDKANRECAAGIHFFLTETEAFEW